MVKWNSNNIKWYESLGYKFTRKGDEFEVKTDELPKNSKLVMDLICDYCSEEYQKTYKAYFRSKNNDYVGTDCCQTCHYIKLKEIVKAKHGVDNVFQLEEVKRKIENTSIEKYGVTNFTKTDEYKMKTIQTNNEKYGADSYTQTEEYKSRVRITNIEKYGEENVARVEKFKEKARQTTLERHGVEHALQNTEILARVMATNNERYGGNSPACSKEVMDKVRATNLERYGVETALQNEGVRQKAINTTLQRYGVKYASQSPIIQEKIAQTYYRNSSIKTSSQQVAIYELLHNEGYNVELNYPVSRISTDIGLFINDIKIDVEYDGWYFHKDKQNEDRKRDEFLKSQGWKILRIKSRRKLPTMKELQYAIDKLVNTDRSFTQIKLDDWGEKEVS